ncbi:TetR/AcrR family transcriptional regulator [Photobacterium kasasachensis]|uniref:TetR/AcrR family transcriptional regulator n=1 Tax=Photobacterium kasasachensis TaxID=2910240 RepID=UPI003D0A2C25
MSKRMDKEARREQLLSIAVSIIESRGADALTLASVAEEAGVTKPIAYNHFETKENLLKQIYQDIDNRLIESIQTAKESSNQSISDIVAILCESYFDCMQVNSKIYGLTIAALKCYPSNVDLSQNIQNFFVRAYSELFQLPVTGDNYQNRLKLISVYGLIESVGEAAIAGQIPQEAALSYLKEEVHHILTK